MPSPTAITDDLMTKLPGKEINRLIERALVKPCDRTFFAVSAGCQSLDTEKLAERVRRQASRLCREKPGPCQRILRARDRLILFLYGNAAPDRAFSAWCDASLKETENGGIAAISGLLLSPQGKLSGRILQHFKERDAVMAEATAVAAVMQVALQVHVQRLRVHSDCVALVQLWLERREDPRLHTIRKLAAQFRWFELCSVPRLHNQPADRLAKRMLEKVYH